MKFSTLGRSFEILKMMTQLGLQKVFASNLKSKVEQARIVADSLSQLKGAAMKAGQMFSMELGDYFPPEAQELLSVLQNAATPAPLKEVKNVIRTELGKDVFQRLLNFSDKPIASASIGQVHTAILEGKKVAVKIQYEEVSRSIDSDLAVLKKL